MAQQDPEQIISAAAEAIVAEEPLEIRQLTQTAGWAVKLAGDGGDVDTLNLYILIAAGRLREAQHLLVDMSFGDIGDDAGDEEGDVLTDLIGPGTTTASSSAPARPSARLGRYPAGARAQAPEPAAPAAATAAAKSGTGGRRPATGKAK